MQYTYSNSLLIILNDSHTQATFLWLFYYLNFGHSVGGEIMRMDKYSNAAYGSAGLTAFFASLSLYEWGFIIGMAFSIILGLATFFMNRREQRKRTRLFEDLVNKTDPQNPSATARKAAELMAKAPKDI